MRVLRILILNVFKMPSVARCDNCINTNQIAEKRRFILCLNCIYRFCINCEQRTVKQKGLLAYESKIKAEEIFNSKYMIIILCVLFLSIDVIDYKEQRRIKIESLWINSYSVRIKVDRKENLKDLKHQSMEETTST